LAAWRRWRPMSEMHASSSGTAAWSCRRATPLVAAPRLVCSPARRRPNAQGVVRAPARTSSRASPCPAPWSNSRGSMDHWLAHDERRRAAMVKGSENLDTDVVRDFGREWRRFDQRALPRVEIERLFAEYFSIFPWESLPAGAVGFDAGCGSGRWAALVAPRVGSLHCIDASAEAVEVARRGLEGLPNVSFHHAPLDAM